MSVDDLNEMQKAIEESNLEIDMDNEKKIEEKLFNEKGEEIGVMGIEEVSSELVLDKPVFNGPITETPNVGGNSTFAKKTIPKGVNKKYNVYWYAATVNYHFHVTVNVNKKTKKGRIVSTDSGNYFVIPPGIVGNDKVTVPQRNETAKKAAQARYTLTMVAPVSTKLWINGKVKNGKFITGRN